MTEFRLYNTMSRSVEPFEPADGHTVRMYTCGPTVYDPAHLGNFRTFLFEDLLRRALRLRGWTVVQVMNLTDVDDKIIVRADQRGLTIGEVTEPVTATFHRDRTFLRIEAADVYPKATDHIPEMIALVQELERRGLAYRADDGSVYFAIGRFAGYGKLSRLDARDIQAGARVAADDYNKEDVRDFALWKAAKPEDERTGAAWDSPWGRGRPGWHLECSAMARKHLGDTLDIHCGGVDLIFPHHEDEIAQSEGATGKTFARMWCHGEFLLTDGAKMAKRIGNVTTVNGLREAGIGAAAVRHFVFGTHYRKQLNLTEEALEASIGAVRRVGEFAERLARATGGTLELAAAADELRRDLRAALFDDLNAPEALAALFTFIRKANAELDRDGRDADPLDEARRAFAEAEGVLALVPAEHTGASGEGEGEGEGEVEGEGDGEESARFAAWVESRLAERRTARAARDFATSDRIRDELIAAGVELKDTGAGTVWRRVAGGGTRDARRGPSET